MSRVLTITGATNFQRTKSHYVSRNFKVGPVSLNFLTIVIISMLALFYLIQSQQAANKGYQIKAMEEAKEEVIARNEELQIESTRMKSIQNIKNTAESLGMVQTKEINYLDTQNLSRR